MKLSYSSLKDEDVFTMTDFSCNQSQHLLETDGLYKIIWNRMPTTSLKVDDYNVELKENEVIFCTPLNNLEIPMDNDSLVSFVFNKEFFCVQTHDEEVSCNGFLFFGSSEAPVIKLSSEDVNKFNTMKTMFEDDLKIKDYLQGEMLRSLLKRLLILSTRMAKQKMVDPNLSSGKFNVIREYNLLVEKHFRQMHQVKDYAKMLYKSPKTLSNLFLKYGNKTPLQYINDRIILEAKRLLLYSDKSNLEIAMELGYNDSSHFSKFFKKHEGQSPNAFKKSKMSLLSE